MSFIIGRSYASSFLGYLFIRVLFYLDILRKYFLNNNNNYIFFYYLLNIENNK